MQSLLRTLLFCLSFSAANAQTNSSSPITLVIHGGAGTIERANMTPAQEKAYHAGLNDALQKGYNVLKEGGTSIQAVQAAIIALEDNPLFNAGKGAVFTHEGKNELDASIMDGETKQAGAVAGVTTIKNPIKAAHAVMTQSPHVMLTGKGAEEFAAAKNIEIVDPAYFHTEARYKSLQRAIAKDTILLDHEKKVKENPKTGQLEQLIWDEGQKFGTVGCVALDQYGNLAAGTSTGGMTNKRFGRIGDAPIIGAGTYANNETCAVSATGHGEYFIRSVVAYDISALMEYKGLSLEQASDEVIMNKLVRMKGDGGVIAVDKKGNVVMPFNTSGMYRGFIKADGKAHTFIFRD